jgi:hypothetical protein
MQYIYDENENRTMQCDARGGHLVCEQIFRKLRAEYYQRQSKGFLFKWKTSVHDRQDIVSPLSVQRSILEF